MRTAWAFRAKGGLLPSGDVVRWRIATAYGDAQHPVESQDFVRFLEWRRAIRTLVP